MLCLSSLTRWHREIWRPQDVVNKNRIFISHVGVRELGDGTKHAFWRNAAHEWYRGTKLNARLACDALAEYRDAAQQSGYSTGGDCDPARRNRNPANDSTESDARIGLTGRNSEFSHAGCELTSYSNAREHDTAVDHQSEYSK